MSRPVLTVALLLALITLAVYYSTGHNGYLNFDDNDYVSNNAIVQDGLTWRGIQWAFTTWYANNWHPLTWLSLMGDCELFGPNAGAEHYVNALLHAANAVLLLLLWFRLTGALWPSALVAALFAWHPLHVESVAWIAERKDVLSTFFELLTLLAYARHAQRRAAAGKISNPSTVSLKPLPLILGGVTPDYFLALFFFTLGLLAKPMLVTVPLILLLLDYWPLQRIPDFKLCFRNLAPLIFEKWPFFLLTMGSCAMTFLAQRHGGVVMSLQQFPLGQRVGNAFLSGVIYLWQAVWPAGLAIVYPFQNPIPWLAMVGAAIFLGLATGFAWRERRRRPHWFIGWLWYLGTLAPVIGLVQVGGQAHADRYTYIPLVGIFVAIAFSLPGLLRRFAHPNIFAAIAALILGACLVLTHEQLGYWQDSESLFRHAVAVTKNNDMAYYCLGLALTEKNQPGEALTAYRQAERLAPNRYEIHRDIGNLLDETGQPAAALAEYREAVQLRPDIPVLHENLGTLLGELGQPDEALGEYAEATRLDPTDPASSYLTGRTLLRLGRDTDAMTAFHQALQIKPDDLPTLLFLVRVLATDENPQIRNGPEALALAHKAAVLAGEDQPAILEALAMANAEGGQFPEAQQLEQQAIKLAGNSDPQNLEKMNRRLKLYQSGRPDRETFTQPPAPAK